jgi:hypothetical protein
VTPQNFTPLKLNKASSEAKEEGRSTNEFTEDINTLLDVEPGFRLSADGAAHVVGTLKQWQIRCSYRTTASVQENMQLWVAFQKR